MTLKQLVSVEMEFFKTKSQELDLKLSRSTAQLGLASRVREASRWWSVRVREASR